MENGGMILHVLTVDSEPYVNCFRKVAAPCMWCLGDQPGKVANGCFYVCLIIWKGTPIDCMNVHGHSLPPGSQSSVEKDRFCLLRNLRSVTL